MKIKLAQRAKRLELSLETASNAEGPHKDRATIAYGILKLAKFITSRPFWVIRVFRESKDMAVYTVTFGNKRPVRVLLAKNLADRVIKNRAENQAALQYVWQQAQLEVTLTPDAYPGIRIPDLHVWRNMNRDGTYVVRLEYVRDARTDERKIVGANPLGDFVKEYGGALSRPV